MDTQAAAREVCLNFDEISTLGELVWKRNGGEYECWGLRVDTPTKEEMVFKDMGAAAAAESDQTIMGKALGGLRR